MRRADLLLVFAAAALPSAPAEAAQRRHFDIPAGRLGDALVALGRQAGVSIGVSDPALARARVGGLRGRHSVEEALRRLLRGTNARHVAIDSVTFRIVARPRARPARPRRAPPPAAPPATALSPMAAEDIVVTAAKREVSLADFPGDVVILEGDDHMPELGLRGSEALVARLPTLTSTHFGPGRNKLFVRGIADSSFSGPTQSTVGQYLGETRLTYNAPDPDLRLYDLDRVEVLAGPQGALYGAGSLGGIVRLVPNPPRLGRVEAALAVGAARTWHGEAGADGAGILNLPLSGDRIAARLVAYAVSEGGYIDDLRRGLEDVNGTRIFGGRAALRASAGRGWTIDLGLTGQRIRGADAQSADLEAPPLTRRSAVRQNYRNDYLLGDAVVSRNWGAYRFVAAAGLADHRLVERFDATGLTSPPRLFEQESRFRLLSFESRLSRQDSDGAGGWMAGLAFVRNRAEQIRALGAPQAPQPVPGVVNIVAEGALFGEVSVRLPGRLTATAGGRLAYSRLSGSAPGLPVQPAGPSAAAEARRAVVTFLPSLALSARLSSDLILFLRYQESFRPGGIGIFGSEVHRYEHDSLTTIEAGLRWGLPGVNRFDLAASLAYTRWQDIQADVIDIGQRAITANIGDGRIYSLDLRLGWRPSDAFAVEAAAVFNDSLLVDSRPSISIAPESPLPNVARVNGRLGVSYAAALPGGGGVRLSAAARYVGRSRLGVGFFFGQEQGDWLDLSLGASADRGRSRFTIGVSNLLDSVGNRFALGSPFLLFQQRQITPLRPRTVRVGWEFSL
jgi:outer membrane receptor protein involved in Fe transport